MSFSGKVVLVTGASSGIGAATAELFAGEGARVGLVARNEAKLASVAQRCSARGPQPLIIKADLSNEEQTTTIIKKTIEKFRKLDVLVNNAGVMRFVSISDPKCLQTFDKVMNTNLRSVVQLINLAAPHLVATKGNVVNVSSVAGQVVPPMNAMSYCVSKAGLDHLTRCVALELAGSGVRVNCISPGPVKTGIFKQSGLVPEGAEAQFYEGLAKEIPLGCISKPEAIAEVITFLASEKAKNITGSNYVIDNGYLLKK